MNRFLSNRGYDRLIRSVRLEGKIAQAIDEIVSKTKGHPYEKDIADSIRFMDKQLGLFFPDGIGGITSDAVSHRAFLAYLNELTNLINIYNCPEFVVTKLFELGQYYARPVVRKKLRDYPVTLPEFYDRYLRQ